MGMVRSVFTSGYEQLVAAVVAMRKSAGLTQRQLAERLSREQNFVARVEHGQRRLDLVEFVWICRACGAEPMGQIWKIVKWVGTPVAGHRSRR